MEVADDLAWVVFSWTPLHAPEVVAREGFTELSSRRERLELILNAYEWEGTVEEVLGRIDTRLSHQIQTMRTTAGAGDATYQRMLGQGLDRLLELARSRLVNLS